MAAIQAEKRKTVCLKSASLHGKKDYFHLPQFTLENCQLERPDCVP